MYSNRRFLIIFTLSLYNKTMGKNNEVLWKYIVVKNKRYPTIIFVFYWRFRSTELGADLMKILRRTYTVLLYGVFWRMSCIFPSVKCQVACKKAQRMVDAEPDFLRQMLMTAEVHFKWKTISWWNFTCLRKKFFPDDL